MDSKEMNDGKVTFWGGIICAWIKGVFLDVSMFHTLKLIGNKSLYTVCHTIEVCYYGIIGGFAALLGKHLFETFLKSNFYKKMLAKAKALPGKLSRFFSNITTRKP